MVNLPDFLIIGAMKAATSTLYEDLRQNEGIFLPIRKEPNGLARDDVLLPRGRRRYARNFAGAGPGQRIGEASTAYSKAGSVPGVPERARKVVGPETQLLYILRDPVDRAVSHHFHEYARGRASADVDRELIENPAYLDASLYGAQLSRWLDVFDPAQVLLLRFESYVAARRQTITAVSSFLGVEPSVSEIDDARVYNHRDEAPVHGRRSRIFDLDAYQLVVKPLLTDRFRTRARSAIYGKPPDRLPPPRRDTVAQLQARLDEDAALLASLPTRFASARPEGT